MKNLFLTRFVTVGLMLAVLLSGCGKRRSTTSQPAFPEDEKEYILAIVFDLSGSFMQLMAEDGRAYDFAMQVVDRYHRNTIGTRDKLVIAQISGTQRSLLWEGTPLQLRHQFPTAASFREFLLSKADPNGSLVNDGLAHVVNYLTADPQVSGGHAKLGLFVLSDMLDSGPNPEESQKRLVQSLSVLGLTDSLIGMYFVDQLLVAYWKQQLQAAGLRRYHVESEIVGKPLLPELE